MGAGDNYCSGRFGQPRTATSTAGNVLESL
jgi:hypothetical protein